MKLHPWAIIHYTCGRNTSAILEKMQGNAQQLQTAADMKEL